jgi:cell fate regulator YaaT (PSP1 superfamily)
MQLVRVRLRKPRRVFSFLCYDLVLRRNDACIVQSDRGLELGEVILPPEPVSSEVARRTSMRVIRRVNEEDELTQQKLQEEESKAFKACLSKVKERRMAMKLVDVEYTFDKKKIIFYFTAEDRVDFRELVRDLAHELKTRIELRHIQVRDEAKMVGGIGGCGRELCCSTWLNEFKPISMRMAKRQNLSLNPSKISGQCGRLLCCLAYENELYEQMKRRKRDESAGQPEPEVQDEALVKTDETDDDAPVAEWVPAEPRGPRPAGEQERPGGNGPGAGQQQRGGRRRKKRRKPREGGGSGGN